MSTAPTGVHPVLEPMRLPAVSLRDDYGISILSPDRIEKIGENAEWEEREDAKYHPQDEE